MRTRSDDNGNGGIYCDCFKKIMMTCQRSPFVILWTNGYCLVHFKSLSEMQSFKVLLIAQIFFQYLVSVSSSIGQYPQRNKSNFKKWAIRAGESEGISEEQGQNFSEQLHSRAHSLTAKECLNILGTSDSFGLSTLDVSQRLQQYGENKLEDAPPKSILAMIIEQFQDRLVQILLGVAVLSGILSVFEVETKEMGIEALVEPIVILSILCLNAVVGIWQTKSAESSIEALYVFL